MSVCQSVGLNPLRVKELFHGSHPRPPENPDFYTMTYNIAKWVLK